jgi:hypothetical protein
MGSQGGSCPGLPIRARRGAGPPLCACVPHSGRGKGRTTSWDPGDLAELPRSAEFISSLEAKAARVRGPRPLAVAAPCRWLLRAANSDFVVEEIRAAARVKPLPYPPRVGSCV